MLLVPALLQERRLVLPRAFEPNLLLSQPLASAAVALASALVHERAARRVRTNRRAWQLRDGQRCGGSS
jgi:hypothetical protein